jgi:hypothetical protein
MLPTFAGHAGAAWRNLGAMSWIRFTIGLMMLVLGHDNRSVYPD